MDWTYLARIFVDSGTDTVDKLSKSNYKILYKKLIDVNNLKDTLRPISSKKTLCFV